MTIATRCTPEQLDRFWGKVNKNGPVVRGELGRCWQWLGAPMVVGYGLVSVGSKRDGTYLRAYAHRLSWELAHGPIPPGSGHHGTCIMHLCDNRLCVNPSHLRAGTQKENLRDMVKKGRGKTPGLRGEQHPRTPFTASDVFRIRSCEDSSRRLAAEYGVSKTAIQRIRQRKSWGHL